MNAEERKQAEEILAPYRQMLDDETMYPFPYIRPSCALKAMEAYASLKLAEERAKMPSEVTDKEIITAADNSSFLNPEWATRFELLRAGFIDGARWFRNRMKGNNQ